MVWVDLWLIYSFFDYIDYIMVTKIRNWGFYLHEALNEFCLDKQELRV